MPCNESCNKYQLHRMQPVTVTSAVASNACYIHIHRNSDFVNEAAIRKPNLNRLYTENISHDYHLVSKQSG